MALTTFHVRRAIDGDTQSLTWVVSRLSPLLLAHAAYRMGPLIRRHHDPEDLVNDAWLVALPKLTELPPRDGRHTPVLLKFLSSTVLYRVQNLAKKYARGERTLDTSPEEGDPMANVPAETSGAVTQVIRNELTEGIRSIIDELEPKDREILMLRGIEQQPFQTVAMLLDLNEDAVSKRYQRALKKLRGRLPGSVFEELV